MSLSDPNTDFSVDSQLRLCLSIYRCNSNLSSLQDSCPLCFKVFIYLLVNQVLNWQSQIWRYSPPQYPVTTNLTFDIITVLLCGARGNTSLRTNHQGSPIWCRHGLLIGARVVSNNDVRMRCHHPSSNSIPCLPEGRFKFRGVPHPLK